MRKVLFLFLIQASVVACLADEYKDPASNVIYTFDPAGDIAEVKEGQEWIDTDDATIGFPSPGSPDANDEIVILDKFTVNGKEYTVNKIGDYAFALMSNVTSVAIPSTVTSIGNNAFEGCTLLSSLHLSRGLVSIESKAFEGCHSLTTVSLPEGLESLGFEVFAVCSKLVSVYIPESVISIDPLLFLGCDALSTIISMIETPIEVSDICQPSQTEQITLYVPSGTKFKYETTSGWEQFRHIEEIQPTGVVSPSDKFVNSRSAQGDASHLKNSVNSNFLDLSGRRLPSLPTRKGIYIKDGRKVLIK